MADFDEETVASITAELSKYAKIPRPRVLAAESRRVSQYIWSLLNKLMTTLESGTSFTSNSERNLTDLSIICINALPPVRKSLDVPESKVHGLILRIVEKATDLKMFELGANLLLIMHSKIKELIEAKPKKRSIIYTRVDVNEFLKRASSLLFGDIENAQKFCFEYNLVRLLVQLENMEIFDSIIGLLKWGLQEKELLFDYLMLKSETATGLNSFLLKLNAFLYCKQDELVSLSIIKSLESDEIKQNLPKNKLEQLSKLIQIKDSGILEADEKALVESELPSSNQIVKKSSGGFVSWLLKAEQGEFKGQPDLLKTEILQKGQEIVTIIQRICKNITKYHSDFIVELANICRDLLKHQNQKSHLQKMNTANCLLSILQLLFGVDGYSIDQKLKFVAEIEELVLKHKCSLKHLSIVTFNASVLLINQSLHETALGFVSKSIDYLNSSSGNDVVGLIKRRQIHIVCLAKLAKYSECNQIMKESVIAFAKCTNQDTTSLFCKLIEKYVKSVSLNPSMYSSPFLLLKDKIDSNMLKQCYKAELNSLLNQESLIYSLMEHAILFWKQKESIEACDIMIEMAQFGNTSYLNEAVSILEDLQDRDPHNMLLLSLGLSYSKRFDDAVHNWLDLIDYFNSLKNIKENAELIENSINQALETSTWFYLVGRIDDSVKLTLKLMQFLTEKCSFVPKQTRLELFIRFEYLLAKMYMVLGYNGLCAISLARAQSFTKQLSNALDNDLYHIVEFAYIQHLLLIGNTSKAQELFEKTSSKCVAEHHFTRSLLLWRQANASAAAYYAVLSVKTSKQLEFEKNLKIIKTLEYQSWTSRILMHLGLKSQAEFFISQGKTLAQGSNSIVFMFDLLKSEIELDEKRLDFESSEIHIEQCVGLTRDIQLEQINGVFKTLEADHFNRKGLIDSSIENYSLATQIMQPLVDASSIESLEQMISKLSINNASNIKYQCPSLQNFINLVNSKKAFSLLKLDKQKEAEVLFKNSRSCFSIIDRENVDLYATHVQIQCKKWMENLKSSNLFMSMISEILGAVPDVLNSGTRRIKPKQNVDLELKATQMYNMLNDAMEKVLKIGSTKVAESLYHTIFEFQNCIQLLVSNSFPLPKTPIGLDFEREYATLKNNPQQPALDLPNGWIVLEMSTFDDHLLIKRTTKSNEQVFRLHLTRKSPNSTYLSVIDELVDILSSSKQTTQKVQLVTATEKRQWWNLRTALDKRLEDLLKKIENDWIGGFKGLFLGDTLIENECMNYISKVLFNAQVEISSVIMHLLNCCSDENQMMDVLQSITEIVKLKGIASPNALNFDKVIDYLLEFEIQMPSSHLVLVLDKKLQQIPWESLDFLSEQSVSRVPSIECLSRLVKNTSDFTKDKVSYVLNPSLDLKSTQSTFEDWLNAQKWNGIVARPPVEHELIEYLTNSDIFLYFGHGGAEQYIKRHTIKKLEKCAVALLLGCSSGKLEFEGELGLQGTALGYLMADSPSVVGNLWDVTDKDLDLLTREIFSLWGLANESKCLLPLAVQKSRIVCKLRYLNAAATVVYGIPV